MKNEIEQPQVNQVSPEQQGKFSPAAALLAVWEYVKTTVRQNLFESEWHN